MADELSAVERLRHKRQSRRRRTTLLTVVALAVLAAGAPFAYHWLKDHGFPARIDRPADQEVKSARTIHESEQFHYRFVLPGVPWTMDEKTKAGLKANLFAMHRNDPKGWFALAARDYGARRPSEHELSDETIRRLSSYFQNLEWEPRPDEPFGGASAHRIVFQGDVARALVDGECCYLISNGIAYWMYIWSRADGPKISSDDMASLRNSFHLVSNNSANPENASGFPKKNP